MTSVFVDTSAWYALADHGDTYHRPANHGFQRLVQQRCFLVTTNHVLGETYTLLRVRLGFSAAQEFLRRLARRVDDRRSGAQASQIEPSQ